MRKIVVTIAALLTLAAIAAPERTEAQSHGQYSRQRVQQQPIYAPGYEPRSYAPAYTPPSSAPLGYVPHYRPPTTLPSYMDNTRREGLNSCFGC